VPDSNPNVERDIGVGGYIYASPPVGKRLIFADRLAELGLIVVHIGDFSLGLTEDQWDVMWNAYLEVKSKARVNA
jgi:hypothetical protein